MTRKVAIVTDSVACLPPALVAEYGIELVPIELHFGDRAYRDGVDISPTEFYTLFRQARNLPTTSAALPGSFLEAYHRASRRAPSILCITLSAKLSGMFNSAQMAVERLDGALPATTIRVLDSGTAAAAQGLVVLAAARAAASGEGLPGVMATAKSVMERVRLLVMLDTLHYLVKGGRAPRLAGLATSLLQVKPILTVADGEVHPVTNPRTTDGALKRILELMGQKIVAGHPLHAAVMHADARDKAEVLKAQVSARFDCAELLLTEFTPVMGAHTGPGVIGVAFYSGD